jgi:hypothetical protein
MPQEPFALSTVPAPAPAERDYDVIYATVMESARGRWFLDEYARRNRSGDTRALLAAIERIERLIRADRDQRAYQSFRTELLELARTIAQTRAEVAEKDAEPSHGSAAATPVAPYAPTGSEVFSAARRIQDVVWTMRERGLDAATCGQIESLATTILDASSLRDSTSPRIRKLISALQYLERRIDGMLETCAQPTAAVVAGDVTTSLEHGGYEIAEELARFEEELSAQPCAEAPPDESPVEPAERIDIELEGRMPTAGIASIESGEIEVAVPKRTPAGPSVAAGHLPANDLLPPLVEGSIDATEGAIEREHMPADSADRELAKEHAIGADAAGPASGPQSALSAEMALAGEIAGLPEVAIIDEMPARAAFDEPRQRPKVEAPAVEAASAEMALPPPAAAPPSSEPAGFLLEPLPVARGMASGPDPVAIAHPAPSPNQFTDDDLEQELFAPATMNIGGAGPRPSSAAAPDPAAKSQPIAPLAPIASMPRSPAASTSALPSAAASVTEQSAPPLRALAKPMPRPLPHDPLAALKAMSDEERIALFT